MNVKKRKENRQIKSVSQLTKREIQSEKKAGEDK